MSQPDHKKEFMKKMFTFDGWWGQPHYETLNRLIEMHYIERIFTPRPEQEEHRPRNREWLYDMKDTQLTFPSYGDDPVWQNVPDDETVGSAALPQWFPGPFSEKDVGMCHDCHRYGTWVHLRKSGEPDTLSCVTGCRRCVEANNWTWGTLKLKPSHAYEGIIDIPCNGVIVPRGWTYSTGNETLSIDLIIDVLRDVWDQHRDHVPPTWSVFFDKSPPWAHTILCEILGFIEGPTVAKDYFMEPGQPMIIDEIQPQGPWPAASSDEDEDDVEDEDGGQAMEENLEGTPSLDMSEEDLDEMVDIIRNMETTDGPLEEEEGGEEEEEEEPVNKVKSAEGLKIIEEIMGGEGQVMDEGKFLELCNIFRDLHQQ